MSVVLLHPLSGTERAAADAMLAELVTEDDAAFIALVEEKLAARTARDAPRRPHLRLAP